MQVMSVIIMSDNVVKTCSVAGFRAPLLSLLRLEEPDNCSEALLTKLLVLETEAQIYHEVVQALQHQQLPSFCNLGRGLVPSFFTALGIFAIPSLSSFLGRTTLN